MGDVGCHTGLQETAGLISIRLAFVPEFPSAGIVGRGRRSNLDLNCFYNFTIVLKYVVARWARAGVGDCDW